MMSSILAKNPRLKRMIIRLIHIIVDLPVLPIGITAIIFGVLFAWFGKFKKSSGKPRLLWAATPIKSLAYMARSLRQAGYKSDVAVVGISSIYQKLDFDYNLAVKSKLGPILDWIVSNFRCYLFFSHALWSYDIFHYYFEGGVLRRTLMSRFELYILRLSGKRIVLMPYGSDAFVYDLIPNPIWRHALLTHYPMHGDNAKQIQNRLRRMTKQADIIVACLFHFVNLPRWDILPLTCYPVDTEVLLSVPPRETGVIRIAHATNHRSIKGTEFLEDAVEQLRQEGYEIELDVIEKVPNTEALKRISEADIYVDQLVIGYAQAALEGLALGKVVISTIENTHEYDLFRQYSYLNECPIVSANAATIYSVLKSLIHNRSQWQTIGKTSRAYCEKRHSFKACSDMYEEIYRKIWFGDTSVDLINFYHPLLEKKRIMQKSNLDAHPTESVQVV